MYSHPSVPLISSFNSSITELLGALCDCSLNDVSWKRHGHTSQDGARRTLKKHAYEALLSRLFQYAPQKVFLSERSSISTTPPKNKVLMISLDLRVAGCQDKAEKLETQLGKLSCGITFWLKELDSVLELLVQLAGSMPQGPTVFSRDYMRRERPVLRKPLLGGYQSDELQRLEAHAWSLVCAEEWAKSGCVHGELGLMDAPLRTGLKAPGTRYEVEEGFEKETRLSLFGALHHTRTSDLDIKLDLPSVPRNADDIGLAIKVPPSLNQSEDEGFQSASNLTPDSQLNPVPTPAIDFWEAFQTFVPERSRYWERVGCSPGKREVPFLTEGGREAFDQLYWLSEEQMRVVNSTAPSPTLSLPLDFQNQLVGDVLNMLIGVASVTFPLNQVSLQFYVRPGVCISGTSAETVNRLLAELAQYGTHYVRLSCFSLQSENKKGLVIQAFSGGLRKCLHYYRACVLSTLPTLSLLTISFLFCKMGRQLRYLSELCCVDGACGKGKDTFPMGVKLLSYLYNEAQSNCSNENYPVLLSLLKSSCEPYTRFVSDWVYSGMFRDVYGEFMIQINEDYLNFRDKHFWVQGYTLISKDVEDCVPVFLRHIAKEVYVCGKTINLLKICCPQHYICWSELSVPRIAVTFSLQEVEEIERDCAVYRGRMERIAKHNITSREEQALRTEQLRQELINQVRQSAAKTLENICLQKVSHRLAEESKKKERFKELKQHLEKVQEKHSDDMRKAEDDDYRFARELRDREKRLKSIEEQLKQKARKDLIAQYSSLSEEAARKESRAVWRVQRMRLDQARAEFLQHDRQQIEAMLAESLLVQEEGCADQFIPTQSTQPEEVKLPTQENTKPNGSEKTCLKATALPSISTPTFFCPFSSITHPETASNTHTISEDVNFHKPLTMPLWPLNSQQMDQSLLENNRIKVPKDTFPPPSVLYDFNTPFSLLEVIATPVQPKIYGDGDASPDTPKHFLSNFSIEANTSQLTGPIHCLSGQATKPSMGQYVPDVPLAQGTKGSVHGQPSMSSVDLSDMSGTNTEQNKNRIHMTVKGNKLSTSDPEDTIETNNRKTAKIRKGNPEWVDLTSSPPKEPPSSRTQEEGGESGNELSLISHSCVIPELFPKNIKSQCSDANIEDVDLVSKVFAPSPTPNNPNNVSNASLKIGKLVCHIDSLKSQPNGCSNLNSISPSWHNSESTLDKGSVVPRTVLTPSQLHGNAPGHASDRTPGIECELSETEPISSPLLGITYRHAPDSTLDGYVESAAALLPSPLMGSTYGHSSDSKLGDWCVVLGADLSPMPLPGSDYGHPSDSTLREGCLVSGTEPLPLHLPGRSYGHSSDSALGVGCVVLGPELRPRHLPGSAYGHSSNSTLVVGCVVSGAEDLPVHHSGSDYGHSSDSTLGQGCVVSGAELLPMHLPGSACEHFTNSNPGVESVVSREDLLPMQLPGSANVHSSSSALVIGGMVSASELQPMRLPGSAYWHSSDFMLAGGCVVSGTEGLPMRLQDSDYSHSSNSTCGVHCLAKPRGNRDQQGNSDELLLRKGITVSTASYDGVSSEKEFLLYLAAQYQVEHYEDCYNLMSLSPESQLLQQVTRGSSDLHSDISIRRATDTTSVQLSAMVSLPVLMKHSVTTPLITHVSLVNKAVVDYMFVELGVERHFEALRHFLLMEDGEFSQSLSDLLFEKLGCGQTPGELLTPLVLNSILSKALQYSLHGDSALAANFTFALRFLPETFHPHAPDSLNCLELRYKVNWPLNIIITDSCMNKYNRLFSLLLQLKHMVWSLRDLWFHLKTTALMKGAAQSVQFRQMQLYRHEMQHFVKVIQGYIANQILQVSWSEFTAKLATASNLDAIHSMHADYLNRAIFRGLLTEKAAPVMNIIHSIFSLILKFRSQLIAHPWECQHGEAVHPSFIAMQQSYNTFKYYSHFLFKVVTKLVNRGYQPHLEDFLLRINFNNYYKDF